MDPRQQRGLVIAATQKLIQKGKVWLVPSQTGNGKKYTVCPDPETPFCSCPDHEETGGKCKHLYAVEYVMQRDVAPDGTITETRTYTVTEKKVYRKPEWPLYNPAQTEEKPRFLVEKTAENFTVKEVPADKAYLSHENLEIVDRLGGTAYIPFKINSVAGEAGTLWEKMFHFYSLNREEFLRKYHQRSNAESVFSMTKAKFGDSVRSRTDTATKNEVYCKFIVHNICCVIISQGELGIEPMFWCEQQAQDAAADTPPATEEKKTTVLPRGRWCAGA